MKSSYPNNALRLAWLIFTSSILFLSACASQTATNPTSQSKIPSTSSTVASAPTTATKGSDPLTAGSGTNRPGASPLELMQNQQVSQELKLTPQQLTQIKDTDQTLSQGIQKTVSGVDWAKLKGDENKQQQLQDQISAQIQTARDSVGKVLTPEQLTRFKQISLQVYGFGILSYDQFSKDLALTAEQQKSLDKLRQDTSQKIRANLEAPENNNPDTLKVAQNANKTRAEQILKESNQQAMNVLTAEQKTKLDTLKGKTFNLETSQQPS